jgi:hypothetical protein
MNALSENISNNAPSFFTLSFFYLSPEIVSNGQKMQKNMNLRYKFATIEVFLSRNPCSEKPT